MKANNENICGTRLPVLLRNSLSVLCSVHLALCAQAQSTVPDVGATLWDWNTDFISQADNLLDPTEEGSLYAQHVKAMMFWGARLYPSGDFQKAADGLTDYLNWYPAHPKSSNPWGSNWTSLGPFNTPSLGGNGSYSPGTGQVHSIGFDPGFGSLNQTMYCASSLGGMFRSTNAGATWEPFSDSSFPMAGVADFAVSSSNGEVIFVGTGDTDGRTSFSTGVFRTMDGGATWEHLNNGWLNQYPGLNNITAIELAPGLPSTLLVATTNGIYRTQNALDPAASVQWQSVLAVPTENHWKGLVFKPSDPSTVYCSGKDVYQSTSFGDLGTWSAITGPGFGLDFDSAPEFSVTKPTRINLATTPAAPAMLYALLVRQGAGGNRSFAAEFDATTGQWNSLLLVENTNKDCSNAWLPIAVGPISYNGEIVAYYGSAKIYRSLLDNGTRTIAMMDDYSDNVHADSHGLAFTPQGDAVWIGHDGGISKSTTITALTTGASQWSTLNNGLVTGTIFHHASSQVEAGTVMMGTQDNGTSVRKPNGSGDYLWSQIEGGDGTANYITPDGTVGWSFELQNRAHMNRHTADFSVHTNYQVGWGPSEIPPMGEIPGTGKSYVGIKEVYAMLEKNNTLNPGPLERLSHVQCDDVDLTLVTAKPLGKSGLRLLPPTPESSIS
ncbi:MAG: hypothetical protein IPJ76_05985 [Flavobacteriales bacterium]|nr:MAG: hypothetical protein IPJ76_05985 [Flavobacteriales bacterium]